MVNESDAIQIDAVFKAADEDRRLVYGVVLAPDEIDLQKDVVSSDTIEKAAHQYMQKSRVVGNQHETQADADVVESFIAPVDYQMGDEKVTKGSWVMVVKVHDDEMWADIKKGNYTGFSIGGVGRRVPYDGE